jgi:membrane-bound lytic murein transglycosylase B
VPRAILLLSLVLFSSTGCAEDYAQHRDFAAFADRMVAEHQFSREELAAWFGSAQRKESILEAIARPAERVLTWGEYRQIFVTPKRIEGGVEFWREHREVLEQAAERYGLPPQMIVAVIGVETRYGGNMGSFRVIDALSTLGFDYPPRSSFFLRELEQFLLLAREQGFDPLTLKGSYAGAMGMGQFIPSSYRAYAVDFDGDDRADIWENEADAIGSVANYFARHRWRPGEPVAQRLETRGEVDDAVTNRGLDPDLDRQGLAAAGFVVPEALGADEQVTAMRLEIDEGVQYWLGHHNFYVITRYNRSRLYAMAVYQLSEAIRERMADGS